MIDYRKIWESINSESLNNPRQAQIARRIPSENAFPVFLATDFRKNTRYLYVNIDTDYEFIPENLPCFRGLEIKIEITSLGEFINTKFIKFTQSIPNTDNIFELVISDICDKIVELQDGNQLFPCLSKVLNEWKVFFEKYESKILSLSAQKGLIGELHFLKDYLFQKYSYAQALNYWTGADRTNHDFQIQKNAIEVKATSGKQHKKFLVSSENQLDNKGLEHLYLALFSLNVHVNMPSRTLPSYINEIYTLITNDPVSTFHFQVNLTKYGYNESTADKYTMGFSLVDTNFFEVVPGFPRLLQANLPNGVGDLKYSVVVAACFPFEIKEHIIQLI